MDVLTLNQILGLGVAFLAILPVPILLNFYYRLRYFDFLLFALVFVFGAIVMITDALVSISDLLITIQVHHITIDLLFFILFLHAIRIHWTHPPKIIFFIGVGWLVILITLTLLWSMMIQPNSAKVLFWELPHTFSSYFPKGAGLMLDDGTIIYSTAFRYLGEFYRIFVISLILYSYLKVKIIHPTKRIVLARKLWFIIWIMLLTHSITLFFPSITELVSIFLLFGGIMGAYIVIRIPEALLISHAQITRAIKLYEKIDYLPTEETSFIGLDSFVEYLISAKDLV